MTSIKIRGNLDLCPWCSDQTSILSSQTKEIPRHGTMIKVMRIFFAIRVGIYPQAERGSDPHNKS